MKKIMISFKLSVKFFVTLLTSREFAFIFVLCGVVAQISHTYFLVESISSLVGWYKIFQATLLSVFISASLLYFVSIAPKQDPNSYEEDDNVTRVLNAVTIFTIIEIIINLFYYTKHLLLDENNQYHSDKIVDFVFGVLVSCLIPWTIKLYASQIRAKEWINEFSDDDVVEEKEITISEMETIFNEKMEMVDTKISESYAKNQQLFLQQFESKLKNMQKKTIDTISEQ